jgi:curved DNA-binding protein CbpA
VTFCGFKNHIKKLSQSADYFSSAPFDISILQMTDHYSSLGLKSDAKPADIKKAFRQKAALYHPDRSTAPDAAERFRAIQKAYEVLADDAKRQTYDDNRKRNLLDNPLETARDIWNHYFKTIL